MTQQMTDRNNSNGNLKGKVALVTGASRGIGYAIATALAQNGINIAINSRSVEDLERVTKDLSSYGVKVLACPADLSDPQAPAELIEDVIAHFGQLDILINNAGIAIWLSMQGHHFCSAVKLFHI